MDDKDKTLVQQSKNSIKKKKKKSSLSICTIFMQADRIDVLLMFLGFLGAVGDGLINPIKFFITSKIMNNLGTDPTKDSNAFVHRINENVVVMLYLACWSFFFSFLEAYCWKRTGERQVSRMRAAYLSALMRQEMGYFDQQVSSSAEVITSVSNDCFVIQDTISEKVPNFLMNVTMFIGSYVVAFLLIWRLALVAFPFIIFLVLPGVLYGRTLMGLARKSREEYNKAAIIAEQVISSIRTVYSFVAESKSMEEFSAALEGSVKLGLKQGFAKGLAIGSNGVIFATWAFISWYGSRLVMYHGAKGGDVYSVGTSIGFGGGALGAALSNLKSLSEAASAGEHIMEVITRVPKIDSQDIEGEILESVSGEIKFENIDFAYPSRINNMILSNFSLKIPATKTTALVGESGSGKSTVIALLERFYDPLNGEILLDGVAIQKLQLKWLRSQMGLVSQEPILFATSIKENILFGKEDATMEEIVAAAKAAKAHNFICQLPQGYETQVGERGVQMSGGQKQRIAIARAIIKAPRILLLDEATSALDSESERIVQEALEKVAVRRTTIIIAHRLSTIRNVDMIAVVKNGQVMETGSHNELIQDHNGLYFSFVQAQETKKELEDSTVGTTKQSNLILLAHNSNNNGNQRSSIMINSTAPTSSSEEEKSFPVPSLRNLLLLNLPEWKQAILGCVGAMLSGVVQPAYAFMMGSMIWVYFLTDHHEIKLQTSKYSLLLASLAVFTMVINIIQHYNFAAMGEYLTKRIRERMLSNILSFEVGWFDQDENSTGAICSKLAKDANTVRSLVGDRMALLVQALSAVAIACTMSLFIAWRLAIVMIAVQPLVIICFYTHRVLLKSMSKKTIKSQEESSKLAAEAVANVRTITAFNSQARILSTLHKTQEGGPRRESIRQSWLAGICLASSQAIMACIWSLDFWYGGRLVSNGYITSKALIQVYLILLSTGRVIADAGAMTTDLAKGADAITSVFSIINRPTRIDPDNPNGYEPAGPHGLTGFIEIKDVYFAYPTRMNDIVLDELSLNIEPNKSIALVGQSGSGKSTIIALIERFYDPLKGTVSIDGRDIKSLNLRYLRKHIGLVSQEPTLFTGTIRDNIKYGRAAGSSDEEVDEIEIVEAAKAANAHDFIATLKDGYETQCGDRGMQLSGGQKQRIAIARAILKNPAVLLLDEATSALDSQSEMVVQEALERLMVGRTVVVVAHRLRTVKYCHLIAVLDKGKVVEEGTHSELLANGPTGVYYSLVSLQHI